VPCRPVRAATSQPLKTAVLDGGHAAEIARTDPAPGREYLARLNYGARISAADRHHEVESTSGVIASRSAARRILRRRVDECGAVLPSRRCCPIPVVLVALAVVGLMAQAGARYRLAVWDRFAVVARATTNDRARPCQRRVVRRRSTKI